MVLNEDHLKGLGVGSTRPTCSDLRWILTEWSPLYEMGARTIPWRKWSLLLSETYLRQFSRSEGCVSTAGRTSTLSDKRRPNNAFHLTARFAFARPSAGECGR